MMYRDQQDQRLALYEALAELHNRGVTDDALATALANAKEAGRIPEFSRDHKGVVSRATINRYRNSSDPYLTFGHRTKIGLLYNFLSVSPDFVTELSGRIGRVASSHGMAPLLQALQDHMGQKRGQLIPEDLKSIVGTYMVYRQAWTSHRPNDFMTSVMTFERVGDAFFFTDVQDYPDPMSSYFVDEVDNGVALPFGMNVVMLARGVGHEVIKFYSLHDFQRFPDGRKPVNWFSGNAMAVSGKGPHPGFPICGVRVEQAESAESKLLTRDEVPEAVLKRLSDALRREI
jgi:hypothetical protein